MNTRHALLCLTILVITPLFRSPVEAQLRDIHDADVVRGLWVSRWEYRTPQDVRDLLTRAAGWGITDVYFQVRGRGDAFYPSAIEPWGAELTGRLGQDPGWDPLDLAISQARQRGLRLHAWINTFTMWSGTVPPPATTPWHIFRKNPGWIMVNRNGGTLRLGNRYGYVLAAPGNPAVQAHIEAVVMDIVERYQVDGIHYDYIRLPDADYSYDAISRGRFLADTSNDSYMSWQADQISGMLARISKRARAARPGIIFSAAVINHYHRAVGVFAQDPAEWTASGALDYVVPMMYTSSISEFTSMLRGYRDMIPASRLVAGINLSEMTGDPGTLASQVLESHLSGFLGHALFSLEGVLQLGLNGYRQANLYSWLEQQQGARFVTAAPVAIESRPEEVQPQIAPAQAVQADSAEVREITREEIPVRDNPEPSVPARKRRFLRWILPTVAGAAVVAILLIF
ncbi:glycoside hydrolase family 10 protein [Gemmatimonadota bacterium]